MRVRLSPRALSEAKRRKRWWRENRADVADLFDEEMAAAIERLGSMPALGLVYDSARVTVRRVLLPKTASHVYYTVREDDVVVLSVWGAERERGPKL